MVIIHHYHQRKLLTRTDEHCCSMRRRRGNGVGLLCKMTVEIEGVMNLGGGDDEAVAALIDLEVAADVGMYTKVMISNRETETHRARI